MNFRILYLCAFFMGSVLFAAQAPQTPEMNPDKVTNVTLSMNIEGGSYLELSNGTIWEVAPEDIQISANWLSPAPVQILDNPANKKYPYKLYNELQRQSVQAAPTSLNNVPLPPCQPQITPPAQNAPTLKEQPQKEQPPANTP